MYILIHGYIEIRKTVGMLMEGAPDGFDVDRVVAAIERVDGIHDVHQVHVWQLDEQTIALEAHLR